MLSVTIRTGCMEIIIIQPVNFSFIQSKLAICIVSGEVSGEGKITVTVVP
jgi:hypothetical protein